MCQRRPGGGDLRLAQGSPNQGGEVRKRSVGRASTGGTILRPVRIVRAVGHEGRRRKDEADVLAPNFKRGAMFFRLSSPDKSSDGWIVQNLSHHMTPEETMPWLAQCWRSSTSSSGTPVPDRQHKASSHRQARDCLTYGYLGKKSRYGRPKWTPTIQSSPQDESRNAIFRDPAMNRWATFKRSYGSNLFRNFAINRNLR